MWKAVLLLLVASCSTVSVSRDDQRGDDVTVKQQDYTPVPGHGPSGGPGSKNVDENSDDGPNI